MRVLERRDRMDWWLTRPEWLRKVPLALMMLLALGIGAVIMAGHGPAVGQVAQIVPGVPPGEVAKQQTPTASVAPPVFVEEQEILVAPAVARAPTEEELFQYEKEIFVEINRRRVEAGVPALVWSDAIATVARQHSLDMAQKGYTGHNTPDGKTLNDRLPGSGENIAYPPTRSTPLEAITMWENSPRHHANFLRATYRYTGIGISIGYLPRAGNVFFVTQDFMP